VNDGDKVLEIAKVLWLTGWNLSTFRFDDETRIVCTSKWEEFTIVQRNPSAELLAFLKETRGEIVGLGALFG
jgi:hypothetical protein